MKSVFSILASVCLFVLARAAVLMGALAYLAPPDFGSELPWEQMNISLVRVLSVEDGEVVLRTERSYTGRKDVPDESVPLFKSRLATSGARDHGIRLKSPSTLRLATNWSYGPFAAAFSARGRHESCRRCRKFSFG